MTKMGMKRTIPQIPLKRKTPLKRTKGLNRMSQRAKQELKTWMNIKIERMTALKEKFGYVPCEYCGKPVIYGSELYAPEAHHWSFNRRENYPDNCRILHKVCNQEVSDKNIKDVPSLL